jgi:hypothetical protein
LRFRGPSFLLSYSLGPDEPWRPVKIFERQGTGLSVYRVPWSVVGQFLAFKFSGAGTGSLTVSVLSVTAEPWGSRALDGR